MTHSEGGGHLSPGGWVEKLFAHSKTNDLRQSCFYKRMRRDTHLLRSRVFLNRSGQFMECSSLLVPGAISQDTFHWFNVDIGSFSGTGLHLNVLR
jgi:hypothetical protein